MAFAKPDAPRTVSVCAVPRHMPPPPPSEASSPFTSSQILFVIGPSDAGFSEAELRRIVVWPLRTDAAAVSRSVCGEYSSIRRNSLCERGAACRGLAKPNGLR